MNKRTVALSQEDYVNIIKVIRSGFTFPDGHVVKPNDRIAMVLLLEGNMGLRLSDVLQLRLSSIVRDGNRYRLNIVEQKTGKRREFTVPIEIYSYIQNYALENKIDPRAKLFDISKRAVQKHLQMVCNYLGYNGIGTHSFRKYFSTNIYQSNGCNIELVRVLLQHSSVTVTQRYIGIGSQVIEQALQNHVRLV